MHADITLPTAVSGNRLLDRLGSFLAAVRARNQAKQGRIRLSQMPDHILSDIGLTPDDVRRIRRTPVLYL